jgi:lipopolysaccharide export LptBFGC system permease protein LptF
LLISVLVALVVVVVLGMISLGDQGVSEDVALTLLVAIPFGLAALVTMYLVRRNS